MNATAERKDDRWLTMLDLAILVVLLLASAGWFFEPFRLRHAGLQLKISMNIKPVLALLALLALRVAWAARSPAPRKPRLLPKFSLGLGMVLLTLTGIEAGLKHLGVPKGEAVFVVRGREGESIRADGSMVSDPELLWRFKPGTVFNGRPVNQLGFLDREVSVVKPEGVRRIISMGDSCTAQGWPAYPGILHNLLQEHPPSGPRWEAFNTAVHGYTVLQGLVLYRKVVANLNPDLVTIFYGWNDHWQSAEEDAERLARSGSYLVTALRNGLARKRITQALGHFRRGGEERPLTVRVPSDQYEKGLQALVQEIQMSGAYPVLLTAPRAETLSRRLVHAHHTPSVEEAIRLHDAYNDITRNIAASTGAHLFDLAAHLAEPHYFSDDGIHYTGEGIERIAQLLHAELTRIEFGHPE